MSARPEDRTPPASLDTMRETALVVTRWLPRSPVRVLEVVPWHGSAAGYLVRVDSPAIPLLDGVNVRPSPKR